MSNLRAVFFDLDGTLLDSLWVWEQIDRDFLESRGIPVPPDYGAAVSTLGFLEAARYTVRRFQLAETPEAVIDAWFGAARSHYRRDVRLKPGAKAYLERLKGQGVLLATATALAEELARPVLENTGILHLFDARFSTEGTGRNKEHPDIFLSGAKALGVMPGDCAFFDDLLPCIRGAKAAGMRAYGVQDASSGYTEADFLREADGFIHSFADAPYPL